MAATQTNRKIKQIDVVPDNLKKSQLYKYRHYSILIDSIIEYVLPFWNKKWRFTKELQGIINKRRISQELEESVPALHFVLKMINDIITDNNNNNNKLSIPLIDLCSGKGILSMLIISFIKLVPKYNNLCNHIDCIYLMDRSWDLNFIEIEEMKSKKQDHTKQAKCPIKSGHLPLLSKEFGIEFIPIRTDIHNQKIETLINELNGKSILVSIHLCRRLSVRAIQLFNSTKNIYGFLLAPCCLPLRGGYIVRIGPLWNKSYQLWSNKNKENIDINQQYLITGITPYIVQSNDNNINEIEIKDDNNDNEQDTETCCFQFALLSKKQIYARNKTLTKKFKLNEQDINKLNECNNNYDEIDIHNQENQIFIASEMLPKDLFALEDTKRYNQWIGFLFNGIDTIDNDKKIYRVPLTGNEHRCDAYLTVQRSHFVNI